MANIRDEILKKILDSITITQEKSIQLPDTKAIEINRYSSLLLSDLMLDHNFKSKLNYLRYYFSTEGIIFFGDDILSIFREMKKEGKTSFDYFKEKLDSLLNKIEVDYRIVKFELYYPINVKTNSQIHTLKFKDIQIETKNCEEVKNLFEVDELKDRFMFEKFQMSKYEYFKVTVWARNHNFAQEIATKYVNIILGVISYSQNYRREMVTFIGIPKELTQIKINYIFVFKEGKYVIYYYSYDKSDDKNIYELTNADISNLNKFIEQFNNANTKIQEILSKSISLYYDGLTEKNINYSFLNLWRALEIITLKKKGNPDIEIVKRLKSAIINITPLDEHKIDRIYSLRNNLVHDGSYNINQYDRNLLKVYVEHMIEFLMFRLMKYNIQEIQTIFQFMQKDNTTLERSKDLADFVISLRKK